MKKQLKAIFDSSTSSQSLEGIDIKSEPVLYTNKTKDNVLYKDNANQYPKDGHRSSKLPSGSGRSNRQKQNARQNYDKWGQKRNPLDKSDNVSHYAICQSTYH